MLQYLPFHGDRDGGHRGVRDGAIHEHRGHACYCGIHGVDHHVQCLHVHPLHESLYGSLRHDAPKTDECDVQTHHRDDGFRSKDECATKKTPFVQKNDGPWMSL